MGCIDELVRIKNTSFCVWLVRLTALAFAIAAGVNLAFGIRSLIRDWSDPVYNVHTTFVKDKAGHAVYPTPPGIALFPAGAKYQACRYYTRNVVNSKLKLSDLELTGFKCDHLNISYKDPDYDRTLNPVIIRAPTNYSAKEALFVHFDSKEKLDFYSISYFIFEDWKTFQASSPAERKKLMLKFHNSKPSFALSANLRYWIKLTMTKTYKFNEKPTFDFSVEYSVVKLADSSIGNQQRFFVFFEWKSDKIVRYTLKHNTPHWLILAGLIALIPIFGKSLKYLGTFIMRVRKARKESKEKENEIEMTPMKDNSNA